MAMGKIAYYRKLKGYTQKRLAEIMGVTTQAVGFWEQGRANPSTGKIEKLAEVLGVTIQDLLDKETDTTKGAPQEKGVRQTKQERSNCESDVEAALRLRRERPEILKLIASEGYTDEQIRAIAEVLRKTK